MKLPSSFDIPTSLRLLGIVAPPHLQPRGFDTIGCIDLHAIVKHARDRVVNLKI